MNDNSPHPSNLTVDQKIALWGIVVTVIAAFITGIFTLIGSYVQRPLPPTNPTVIVITATFVPTITPFPTSTSLPSQPIAPTQPGYILAPLPTPRVVEPPPNTFRVPWSDWTIDFIVSRPMPYWVIAGTFLGVLFLAAGVTIFFGAKSSCIVRSILAVVYAGITLALSIREWGWWGILWGLLLVAAVEVILSVRYGFGAIAGATAGILTATSFSLFYISWSGSIDRGLIAPASIIGGTIGMLLGTRFIEETIQDP